MAVELAPVVKRLGLARRSGQPRRAHGGKVGTVDVVACLGGVGPGSAAEATRWAIDTHSPDHVMVSGIAGGMETAAVAEVCAAAGIPWTAYRGISDLVDEGLVDDTALSLMRTDGTTNALAVAKLAVSRPQVLVRLARLNQDTQRATGAAASDAARGVGALAAVS